MRDRFTRVLKGHIAIARAVFPDGTSGAQLDSFARAHLWAAGLDFDHGTGHGVGSYLSVHEGPARISKLGTTALKPGMILSNEPGYYKTGAYGIRIENLVLTIEAPAVAGAEKPLLAFETLTLAPIDRRLIAPAAMTAGRDRMARRLPRARARPSCRRCSMTPPAHGWRAPPRRSPDRAPGPWSRSRPRSVQAPTRSGTPWRLLGLLICITAIGPTTLNILVPALPEPRRFCSAPIPRPCSSRCRSI